MEQLGEEDYSIFSDRTVEENSEYLGKLLFLYRQGLSAEEMKREDEALESFSIEGVAGDLEKLGRAMEQGLPGHVEMEVEKEARDYGRSYNLL